MFNGEPSKSKEPYRSSRNSSIEFGIQRPVDDADIELQQKDVEMPPLDPPPPAALDWDHPDDEKNPRNWPFMDRVFQTLPPALFNFVV